jgi:hypothetical protein
MLTLKNRIAAYTVAATRMRPQAAAAPTSLFARFLAALVRALGTMHA